MAGLAYPCSAPRVNPDDVTPPNDVGGRELKGLKDWSLHNQYFGDDRVRARQGLPQKTPHQRMEDFQSAVEANKDPNFRKSVQEFKNLRPDVSERERGRNIPEPPDDPKEMDKWARDADSSQWGFEERYQDKLGAIRKGLGDVRERRMQERNPSCRPEMSLAYPTSRPS